jgi:transketolase
MSLPDVAWFRSLSTSADHRGNPGCYVLQPADAYAAYALTGVMAEYEGLCYMRTLRADTEFLYGDDQVFNLGGFETLTEGRDVVICAAATWCTRRTRRSSCSTRRASARRCSTCTRSRSTPTSCSTSSPPTAGTRSVVEDNYGGGLGSAIADALVEAGDAFQLEQMHVERIPKSAKTPRRCWRCAG